MQDPINTESSFRDTLSRYKAEKLKIDHEAGELAKLIKHSKNPSARHLNALRALLQAHIDISAALQGLIDSHEQDEHLLPTAG